MAQIGQSMTTGQRPDNDLAPFLFIFRYLLIAGDVGMRQLKDIADLNLKYSRDAHPPVAISASAREAPLTEL
jgi:hypothetical protein